MDTLHQHTTNPLPSNLQLEYKTVDILTCDLMVIVEENYRNLFKGEIPWSPVYKNIILTLLHWIMR